MATVYVRADRGREFLSLFSECPTRRRATLSGWRICGFGTWSQRLAPSVAIGR